METPTCAPAGTEKTIALAPINRAEIFRFMVFMVILPGFAPATIRADMEGE